MTKALRFPIITNAELRRKYHAAIRDAFPNEGPLSYFIKEEDSDNVKIGMVCSKWGVEQRLTSLQTSTPHRLVLVGVSDAKERDLHRQFAHLRVRGEWFKYTDEIKSFLKNKFPMPLWLKSMKCPSCKKVSTFRQEEVHKYGDAYPLRIGDNGEIYADHENKRGLHFPDENLDISKCICNTCNSIVSIDKIELIDTDEN